MSSNIRLDEAPSQLLLLINPSIANLPFHYTPIQRLFKMVADEAAGKTKPQAYPLGYVEDFVATRTKSATRFNSRYSSYHFSR